MTIHWLDIVMWVMLMVAASIVLRLIDEELAPWAEDLGGLMGMTVLGVLSIIYLIAFALWPDWNWFDLFSMSGGAAHTITIKP